MNKTNKGHESSSPACSPGPVTWEDNLRSDFFSSNHSSTSGHNVVTSTTSGVPRGGSRGRRDPNSPSSRKRPPNINGSSTVGQPIKDITPTQRTVDGVTQDVFECPLCNFECFTQHKFHEHAVSHATDTSGCPKCDFTTENTEELVKHCQTVHGDQYYQAYDEDESNPKTNTRGKNMKYRCMHCSYTTQTRKEFWDHGTTHIKASRKMKCPFCNFVTNYKHHWEYHISNHTGFKPFKCADCKYTCINKSMLTSHEKSHLDVKQFRCKDCRFAAKHCHALKKHCRKHHHKAHVVLNPNGTPNPDKFIDVYGKRRGPKSNKKTPPVESGKGDSQEGISMKNRIRGRGKKEKAAPAQSVNCGLQSQLRANRLGLDPNSSLNNQTPPSSQSLPDNSEVRGQNPSLYSGQSLPLPQTPFNPAWLAMFLQINNGLHPQQTLSRLPSPVDVFLWQNLLQVMLLNPQYQYGLKSRFQGMNLDLDHINQRGIAMALTSGRLPTNEPQISSNDLLVAMASNRASDMVPSILTDTASSSHSNGEASTSSFNSAATSSGSNDIALDLSGSSHFNKTGNSTDGARQNRRKGLPRRRDPTPEQQSSSDVDDEYQMEKMENNHEELEYEAIDLSIHRNIQHQRNDTALVADTDSDSESLSSSLSHHKNPFSCSICNIQFINLHAYIHHMQMGHK